jgi:head-tail adaptor
MNIGPARHFVLLEDPIEDGTPVVFQPDHIWAAIRPSPPGAFDEQKVTHIVETRYHPQITYNTRIKHRDRYLYVRGIQNVDEQNRQMFLLCEEVVTP